MGAVEFTRQFITAVVLLCHASATNVNEMVNFCYKNVFMPIDKFETLDKIPMDAVTILSLRE